MSSSLVLVDVCFSMLLSVLIVIANIFIIVVLIRSTSLHSPTNVILCVMAFGDLGFGFNLSGISLIETGIFQSYWGCLFVYSVAIMSGSVSMHMLIFVSIDRYIQITRPLHYYNIVTYKRVGIGIAIDLTFCSVMAFSPVMGVRRDDFDGSTCSAEFIMAPVYFILTVGCTFMICISILVYVYYKIYRVAFSHRRRIAVGRDEATSQLAAHFKAAKLFALLCGYFLMSWTPHFLDIISSYIRGRQRFSHEFSRIGMTLAASNSLGNPVIYALRQAEIKRIIRKMFPKIFSRQDQHLNGKENFTRHQSNTNVSTLEVDEEL
ncbi:adenosine receptor A2b-like [Haliotis rufescens]|uniref:adenosine receptor A2b-like n=1 Tax=Haliotis rufescens TaxID=6454 RepID=UPI00201E8471|nr:adenosine receptor A2b-like [Haliotis rufescens]